MLKLRLDWSALQCMFVFRSAALGFSKLCVLLPSSASPSFVFVYSWGSWFKHNHGFRQCFTLVVCLHHHIYIIHVTFIINYFFSVWVTFWGVYLTQPCSMLQHGTNSRHYLWGGGVSFIMPAWPPLATGNGTFWTWRPAVLWLSSWLWIFRPTDWPQSSWTDRSPGCHPLPLTLVLWLLQGPRQILWWVIKPNCLYGWQASRSWMANSLRPVLLSSPTLSSWEYNVVLFSPGVNT